MNDYYDVLLKETRLSLLNETDNKAKDNFILLKDPWQTKN